MTRPVSVWANLRAIAAMLVLLMPAGLAAPSAVMAADPEVISSVDFDDGTTGSWTQSGNPTLGFVDDGAGGQALSILRAQDFEGIQSPAGLLEHDVVYTLSMRARLPEGTAGSTEARLVVKPNFTWVGNATIDGSGWTTISGTYTLPDEVDPAASQVYVGSTNQAAPYTLLVDDILITAPAAPPPTVTVLSTDFEDGFDGWVPRGDAQGDPTVTLTTDESHSPTHAALVSDRTSQGDGIGHDVTGIMDPGTTYVITAWVKFAAGNPTDTLWLSMRRTNDGSDSFDTLGQFTSVSGTTFVEVNATYTMGEADSAFIYFESRYPDGTSAPFLVDDITIASQAPPVVEDLPPVKDSVDFPLGSAIDSRETTGASSELLLRHFDQVTPENHMKPEAWYDDARTFRIHPEAQAIMDFAQENTTRVYGHTLVWHSQTPAWFFQHDDGSPLTTSDADKALLRTRLQEHISNVAETLSDMYGPFGSSTNPLIAFDVVNEAVSDGTTEADGLRRSPWYNVLGESYIDDAFVFANEAFNQTYAADGADHPVTLVINDYNTEQSGKRQRLHDLVSRLLDRGVPVDAVGHQFHLSLSTPVGTLEEAITAFEDLPVTQVVSEMDVTTGTPVDAAKLIDQGYYYRDAFRIFRAHSDDLFAVTLWGLHDARSWRSAGAPLLFDGNLKAKPAYFGAVDGELPARLRSAFVFQGSVALDGAATGALEWQQLPLHRFGDDAVGFQLRWEADHLTAYVEVADATPEATDAATFVVDDATFVFRRDGTGDVPGVVAEEAGGWKAVVHLPLTGAAFNDQLAFDVAVTDGADTVSWNDAGATGHVDARRARLVHGRHRGGDRSGHRRRDRRRMGGRDRRLDRQADRGEWGSERRRSDALERQHAVRPRPRYGPDPRRHRLRPVDRGFRRDLRRRGQRQERLVPLRRHPDPDQLQQRHVVRHRRRGVPGQPAHQRHEGRGGRIRRRGLDQPPRGRWRRDVPRSRLPGERRDRRRTDVDPELGRSDRARLPEHLALGRRPTCRGAGPDLDHLRRQPEGEGRQARHLRRRPVGLGGVVRQRPVSLVLVRPRPCHRCDRPGRARRGDDQRRRPGEVDRGHSGLDGGNLRADRQLRGQRLRVRRLVDVDGDHGHGERRAEPVGLSIDSQGSG